MVNLNKNNYSMKHWETFCIKKGKNTIQKNELYNCFT